MIPSETGLGASHAALVAILRTAPDLRDESVLVPVLDLLRARRTLDLTDLAPTTQARLIAARCVEVPEAELAQRLTGRLIVKFGIDPTAADVHIGHAVPMILASRFQRMGHQVVFIVGDITATIGDPSGRTAGRPPLTEADVAHNLASYREQVSPFFQISQAEFRRNSEWLGAITLPRLLGVLAQLPVSASLQRDDFRTRLAAGSGLTLAELVYSVVMALDSLEVGADVEIGGLDQLLNMRMGRRIMANAGQPAQLVAATPLIEGTDGTGVKMSKSLGNFIGLAFSPADIFGRLMAVPDRLLAPYLRALTELLDPEIEALERLHPMGRKLLLASDLTGTIAGPAAAAAARADFTARFSQRRFSAAVGLPVVRAAEHAESTVAELFVRTTRQVASLNQVRRVAAGGGLRVIVERPDCPQETITLVDANVRLVGLARLVGPSAARVFLKCGRAVVEISGPLAGS